MRARVMLHFFAASLMAAVSVFIRYSHPVTFIPIKQNNSIMNNNSIADTGFQQELVSVDTPVLISNKFSFTEGPAVDKEGNIFFTDQPNNQIWKYDVGGKLSLFMKDAGRSNGMFFDKAGNLVSCTDEYNQLSSINPDKVVNPLCSNFNGGIFNGPNDVWVNPINGDMYFTDPYYKRDYWSADHPHMEAQNTYYLKQGSSTASIADSTLTKPNGIIGTADGKYLFVADIGGGKTYKYEIGENGKLLNKTLFVNQGSDGMTLDVEGNIYLTGKGVNVYNKKGKLIQHIPIEEDWTGNVCFGGKNLEYLFITASKSVYKLAMKVRGQK